ncbi:MAG: phosphatase [Acutalibacteraceae bacterium]|nr:phosphatase [Clostridia bacterium]MEE3450262.1 phosphatase [Acutalibacteraceae bacterium]
MKIVADMHTHSIASTHAYGTVKEMAAQAAEIGLYAIGITDHGPAMPGSPRTWYFDNFAAIPKTYMGVRVLMGAEANITDDEGHIDIEESVCRKIEWIVASVHHLTIDENKREYITNNYDACTQLYLNIADNPYVNVIGHCGSPAYKFDYERVIPVLAQKGKLIEINNSSFKHKKASVPNCIEIAKICKKTGARIIVNTDAHFMTDVGRVEPAFEMLEEIGFPQELIVNSSVDRFERYLIEHDLPLRE